VTFSMISFDVVTATIPEVDGIPGIHLMFCFSKDMVVQDPSI